MGSRTLNIPDIGDIQLIKSDKAKNVSITIEPLEGVIVKLPRRCSYAAAEEVVFEKITWIRRNKKHVEIIEEQHTIFDDETIFKTREHELEIIRGFSQTIRSRLSAGKIKVYIPLAKNIKDKDAQEAIREGIEKAMRKEAKEYLPQRISLLAYENGFYMNRVFIKNTKTMWGSCSYENNINLSMQLMRLPDELIDYVMLHELAHTVEKNHSKKFWELLERILPGAKRLDKELKNYRTQIY